MGLGKLPTFLIISFFTVNPNQKTILVTLLCIMLIKVLKQTGKIEKNAIMSATIVCIQGGWAGGGGGAGAGFIKHFMPY